VIAGGESGPRARKSQPEWFRSLRDQCEENKVAFHFKQWGDWFPIEQSEKNHHTERTGVLGKDTTRFVKLGKKVSGRTLDGRTWDDVPDVRAR